MWLGGLSGYRCCGENCGLSSTSEAGMALVTTCFWRITRLWAAGGGAETLRAGRARHLKALALALPSVQAEMEGGGCGRGLLRAGVYCSIKWRLTRCRRWSSTSWASAR
ncbi:hypothetical protein KCP71_23555 [Salmonella enterica subsp. enterica]|nr:hypothetical protein KCP71_23555 [Salmonella enterica subsp. enterica]